MISWVENRKDKTNLKEEMRKEKYLGWMLIFSLGWFLGNGCFFQFGLYEIWPKNYKN